MGGSRLRHATRARCHRRLQLVPPEHDAVSRAQPSTSWTAAPAPADQRSSSGRYGPAVLRRRDQVSACGVVRVGLSRRRERRRIDSKLTFRGGGRYCTLDRSTRICLTDLSIMVSWGGRRTAGRYRGRRCNVCASQSARAYFARYSVCSARRCPQTRMVARARISWWDRVVHVLGLASSASSVCAGARQQPVAYRVNRVVSLSAEK